MPYDFSAFDTRIKEIETWFSRELAAVRTGRATPAILDGVRVDAYGSKMPVAHVANISVEDAKTLRITPWDKQQIKDTEKAIDAADLGVSVIVDGEGLRVAFPELTAERRDMLVKAVNRKLEEARVSVREARDEAWSDIQKKERDGLLSEDEKFSSKEHMEQKVKDVNKTLEDMAKKKEEELRL